MKYGSASAWPRIVACPTSVVLPQSDPDVASAAAARGTAIHAFLEDVANGTPVEEAIAATAPEHRGTVEQIQIGDLGLDSIAAEVTFAMLPDGRAREIGRGLNRDYSAAGPDSIVGTADVVGMIGEAVYVADYKTGRARQVPAGDHWQLRILAAMAADAYSTDEAIVEIIQIGQAGEIFRDRATLDAFDLAAIRKTVRETCATIDEVRTRRRLDRTLDWNEIEVREGDHCRFCPAMASCPAKTRLLRVMAQENGATAVGSRLTEENCTDALDVYLRMKSVLDAAGRALHAFAREHPIPCGDGKVYGPVETTREKVDGAVAHDVLAADFGPEVAVSACSMSTSKTAITDALRDEWKRRKADGEEITLKSLTEGTLHRIHGAGGIESKTSTRFDRVAPERIALPEGIE